MNLYAQAIQDAAEEARASARRCREHADGYHAHQRSYLIGAAIALEALAYVLDSPAQRKNLSSDNAPGHASGDSVSDRTDGVE